MQRGRHTNDIHNKGNADANLESSDQMDTTTRNLPASKIFDLKVIPSERDSDFHTAHSFCATCSTPT